MLEATGYENQPLSTRTGRLSAVGLE